MPSTSSFIIKILLPKSGLFPLDYLATYKPQLGELVVVPFRRQYLTGIVWANNVQPTELDFDQSKLKFINAEQPSSLANMYKIRPNLLQLIKKTADYYLAELGSVAKLVLPLDIYNSAMKAKQSIKMEQQLITTDKFRLNQLTEEQASALELIKNSTKPVIINGVTGSGKTEIYFTLVAQILEKQQQALIMLPEIALSEQIIARFTDKFGFKPAIWNSTISPTRKKKILHGIITGEIKIVIGARSSLFLPYKNLNLIVVDEEHDASYKQSENLLYNARDMAVLRSSLEQCKILLVSATPAIESIYNAQIGKYDIVYLTSRFNAASLPKVEIINMRQEKFNKNKLCLSMTALEEIKKNIQQKNQTLIFLNKRGYTPLLLCRHCGHKLTCSSCSASLVLHKKTNQMICHHCNFKTSIPKKCSNCKDDGPLILYGYGIERLAEEITDLFPDNKITTISSDLSRKTKELQATLKAMEDGKIDILIGTQIITKGYHFPNLTLVIIVDTDLGFIGGDLKASERNFQLLQQVGGRAGREVKAGTVLLQTYYPEHKVIKAIANYDQASFIQAELESRKSMLMPPYGKSAVITITGRKADKTYAAARLFITAAPKSQAQLLGPAEAAIFKLSNKYRYRILVLSGKDFNLQKYLTLWKEYNPIPSSFLLKIDIDPYHFI